MRRFLLKFGLFLVALVTITAGVGWYLLHDEAFLKSQLSAQTLKYTGRELTINGPVTLDLGRETTLKAHDIHFANPGWASQPDMVTVGYLLISIDITTLFSDRLVFPALVVDECAVNLLRNEAGEPNWKMHPQTDPKPEEEPEKPPRKEMPVWTKDIKLSTCELYIASTRLEDPLDVKVADLAMQHHDDSRWESKGSGSLNDQAIEFDSWFAPFSAIFFGGPLEHELKLSLGDTFTLQSSGSVQDAATWTGANISAEFKGPEIADILNEFKLPLFTEGAFDYKLSLNTEGKMTKIDLDGDLGSVNIKAEGELDRLVKPTMGSVELSVDGPNLGALAKVLGVDGVVEDEFNHETHAAFEGDKIHFKKVTLSTSSGHLEIGGHFGSRTGFADSELDIHFETNEIGRWTRTIGQPEMTIGPLMLDGKLSSDANGLFSIQGKVVQGQTSLDVNGALGILVEAFQPDLEISFESSNPSPLAEIAGLAKFPAAPLAIKGRFGMKDRQITLGNFSIDLAGDQANINGVVNLQDHFAGSDVTLGLDIRNTANLGRLFGQDGFPDQPVKLSAEITPEGKGLAFQVKDGNLGKVQIELDGKIEDLERWQWINANFDISLPRLSDLSFLLPKTKLADAPFTARGQVESKDERIELRKVNINLAGNQANIDGHINPANHYVGSKLNIELDIKNAGELARMFGKDGLPDEPMKLNASIQPAGKGLDFKVSDGNLRDIQVEVEGQIADLEYPMGVEARFDIALPRLSDVSFLFPDRNLPDVSFIASGRLHNETSQTSLDNVKLALGEMTASVDGKLFPDNRFDLSVKAAGPDASALDKLVGTSLPAESFSIVSGLSGNPADFELTDLDVYLGRSKVDGNLAITLGDAKHFKGKLNSPYLDISHWYPGAADEEKSKPAAKSPRVFNDAPMMQVSTHGLYIDLDLQIDKLYLENTTLQDVTLGFLLSDQLLELKPISLKGERGGQFVGEYVLDGRGDTPHLRLNLHGEDVRLGLASAPGQDPSTFPPMEIEVALEGTGTTRHEVAASLNGKLRAYLGSGQYASAGLNRLFTDFITEFFTLLNPFHKTSTTTQLECAVLGADAKAGMVKVFPLIYHSQYLTTISQGTVNLDTEKIDLAFNSKPRKGLGLSSGTIINPFIKLGGTLAAPAVQLDPAGTITSGGLAVATLGISVLAKSMADRFLSSNDPCGDARKEIAKRDSAAN
jgi:uncharacterized protein involved in outer membrane biogenesis